MNKALNREDKDSMQSMISCEFMVSLKAEIHGVMLREEEEEEKRVNAHRYSHVQNSRQTCFEFCFEHPLSAKLSVKGMTDSKLRFIKRPSSVTVEYVVLV